MQDSAPQDHTVPDDAPVYFLDLVVENVRCFKERQVLDLSDGNGKPARWTVLLGDNGTGKTTLLKCLTGLELQKIKMDGYSSNHSYVLNTLPKGFYVGSDISREIKNFCRTSSQDFHIGASAYCGYFSGRAYKIHEFSFSDRYSTAPNKLLASSEHPNNEYIESFVKKFKIYAYGASRRMSSSSFQPTDSTDATVSLFSTSATLLNAEEWFLQADYAVKSADAEAQKYTENRFNKIKEMLLALLPDVTDLSPKPITKTQLKAAIQAKTPYGWVDMQDLSLGYQTLIAWMVDLAARLFERYSDSDNPLAEPAIVLVDEIDLHLHPKWQRTLISRLSELFPNTQFIVTAHSPLIVQAAQDANIVLLKREGDQVKIYNKDQAEVRGWRYDQILTSDLFDLISARPPEYDRYLQRREEILAKPELNEADQAELEKIGAKLDELPVTDTPQDSEAMELLRKAAGILKQNKAS